MNLGRPLTPSLSPSEGERVPEGRVRGWFMVPMRVRSWRSRLPMNRSAGLWPGVFVE